MKDSDEGSVYSFGDQKTLNGTVGEKNAAITAVNSPSNYRAEEQRNLEKGERSEDEDDIPRTHSRRTDNSRPIRNCEMAIDVDGDEGDDDDVPLIRRRSFNCQLSRLDNDQKHEGAMSSIQSSATRMRKVQGKRRVNGELEMTDEGNVPLARRTPNGNGRLKRGHLAGERKAKIESDSKVTVPPANTQAVKPTTSAAKRQAVQDGDESDNVPLLRLALRNKKAKTGSATVGKKVKLKQNEDFCACSPASKVKTEKIDESEDEVYKWWEEDLDNSKKWNTLEHSGVLFPPDYKPHGVKMNYDGAPVTLSPVSEEVAGFFAQLLGTQYAENPVFCANFFEDFLKVLKENDPDCLIEKFELCDFKPMFDYFELKKEEKKNLSKEEKLRLKEEKKMAEEKYAYAFIDGRREKVGNFRVEPPGLFRGRGDHPKTGKVKITINIGEDAPIPSAPDGHKWGGVVHDNTVSWLATWTENVNNNIKYVFFAAGSSLKGMSDLKKFEKARELKNHIIKIRNTYMSELRDELMMVRQRATAMWLIDKLALRAGNEKGEDEADTVGCCSLRYEHVELDEEDAEVEDPRDTSKNIAIKKKMVTFDFLGKDSIRYYNRVEVDPVVWKNLKLFKKPPKKQDDPIFDRLTTASLNKHLNSLMPGLTAKVFRTYNASITFQNELKKTPKDAVVQEKMLAYNRANRQVAILCNHQRTVPKCFGQQMEKLAEKILLLKYERWVVKREMLELDPKLKKTRPEMFLPEKDLDEETIKRKSEEYEDRERERLTKKWEKLCEKAKMDGQPIPNKDSLSMVKRESSISMLEKKYESLSMKIEQALTVRVDKDENKTTALGTSKINYIDPRITTAWCKRFDVPIEKMFTKTLREKFKWAMGIDEDWIF